MEEDYSFENAEGSETRTRKLNKLKMKQKH